MIQCSNCETAQWLQIVRSELYSKFWEDIDELTEEYTCTLCGGEGKLEVWEEDDGTKRTRITGDVEETNDRPWECP